MKNFVVRYPVSGTAALQPKLAHPSSRRGAIIQFPMPPDACSTRDVLREPRFGIRDRVLGSDMVRSLRHGTARGCAYGRVAPWQAVVAGAVFAAATLFVLFL